MIRLRKADGTTMDPEENWGFVELCDSQGKPAFVLYKDGDTYKIFGAADKEALRYSKVFGVEFVPHKAIDL